MIFLVLGLIFPICQLPASESIAVVDLMKIFESHPETARATAELTKERDEMREVFKEKSNALKEVLQKHQELIRAGKRDTAAEELKKANELEKAIATLRTTQQRDLEEKFRRTKHRILESITESIREHNKEGKYAVILDSSSRSSNGLPQVIHSPGAIDITEEIAALVKKATAE